MKIGQTFGKLRARRSTFLGSVLTMAGGNALGQALTVAVSPVLTRIYSPTDFGVLAVQVSLLSIILIFAGLRYEFAIPLPKDDGTAAALLTLALSIVVGMSALTGGVVWLVGGRALAAAGAGGVLPCLAMLPLGRRGPGVHGPA